MKYTIEHIDSIVVFAIKNKKIDTEISADLKEQLLIVSQPDIKALIVDITDVESIDDSGISSFLLAERQLSDHGVPMAFVGACDNIQETLRILNLHKLFDFFDTTEEAKTTISQAL
jgi:anti-anti-sigma factor